MFDWKAVYNCVIINLNSEELSTGPRVKIQNCDIHCWWSRKVWGHSTFLSNRKNLVTWHFMVPNTWIWWKADVRLKSCVQSCHHQRKFWGVITGPRVKIQNCDIHCWWSRKVWGHSTFLSKRKNLVTWHFMVPNTWIWWKADVRLKSCVQSCHHQPKFWGVKYWA